MEREGDLAAAAGLYLEAGLPDEAARVLLLRADAEPQPERRIAFCAQAASTAQSEDLRRRARSRKALMTLDVLRSQKTTRLSAEITAVARELEELGDLEHAADAYALAGDTESEIRTLTAAGAIERLEERFKASDAQTRSVRQLDVTLRRAADLDRTAERRAAIELLQTVLAANDDERLGDMARAIRARLLRGPVVDLEIAGVAARYVLGSDVTIGRGDSSILVASRAISRRHVRIRQTHEGPVVEDLGTRNGTTLAGARLSGPIAVGQGVQLDLGGQVPCRIAPASGPPGAVAGSAGVVVEVAGERYVAPLGELAAGAWRLVHQASGEDSFIVLRTPDGAPRPFLGGFELSACVELCAGDEICASRGGPVVLRPLAGGCS